MGFLVLLLSLVLIGLVWFVFKEKRRKIFLEAELQAEWDNVKDKLENEVKKLEGEAKEKAQVALNKVKELFNKRLGK